MLSFFLVALCGLCCCGKENSQSPMESPLLSGPSEALVNDIASFFCELLTDPGNETMVLKLYKEGDRQDMLSEYTSLHGDIAVFNLIVKESDEGNLECVAHAQNNSDIIATVSDPHYLRVVEPVKGANVSLISGPAEFFEGRTLELRCHITAGNHVTYRWLRDGQLLTPSPLHHIRENNLTIYRTTSADSGSYMCSAMNHLNSTQFYTSNSSQVNITVKDVVSRPEISFTVLKEGPDNFYVVVTCQSARGTLPVTFSLSNTTEYETVVATKERKATYKMKLHSARELQSVQCLAVNGDTVAYSRWLPLTVVHVDGPVTMRYDSDTGDNYAVIGLRIYCRAANGSHAQFQWFLNGTLLEDKGSFYHVFDRAPEESILLMSIGRNSAGTYHCEVSDSFDSSNTVRSKPMYLDIEVLNRLPILVVAVVFGCFSFLVIVVSVCCGFGVAFRRKVHKEQPPLGVTMQRMEDLSEDDMEISEYNEDADSLETPRNEEFDQNSFVSVEDWPQTEEVEEEEEEWKM